MSSLREFRIKKDQLAAFALVSSVIMLDSSSYSISSGTVSAKKFLANNLMYDG